MSKGAGRARTKALFALGGLLAAGAAILLRTWAAGDAAPRDVTAKPVSVDRAFVPETPRPTPPPPRTLPAALPATNTDAETSRRVIDPAEALQGPSEPLTPPEIRVDVEVDSRGATTAAPLVPPVIQADIEVDSRGTIATEPLTPPVLENPAEPVRR